MTKITAIPKTAEEITGIFGCISFLGKEWGYSEAMDRLARKGERLELTKLEGDSIYDYKSEYNFWKDFWLRDVEEKKERTWKVGDYVEVKMKGSLAQLCYRYRIIRSGPEHCFLLEEGECNRWRDPIVIKDVTKITEEEMEKMLGDRFNLIN